VARDRSLTACENRRHQVGLRRRSRVTDGIDAAVHPSQPPVRGPTPDPVAVDACAAQLPHVIRPCCPPAIRAIMSSSWRIQPCRRRDPRIRPLAHLALRDRVDYSADMAM